MRFASLLRTAPLALTLIALGAPLAPAQDAGTQQRAGLAWTLHQGDQLHYTYTWSLEQKTEVGNMPMDQANEVVYGLDQQVTAVGEDGAATIQATIRSLRVRLGAGMMGELTYDSASDGEDNPFAWLGTMVGKSFTYTMKPTGEVTSVTGGDELRAAVTKAAHDQAAKRPNPGGMGGGEDGGMGMGMDPGAMMDMIAGPLTVIFTNDSLKSSLEVTNHVLPEAGAQGQTWTRPVAETIPNVGEVRFTGEYTNRGSAGPATRITVRASDEVQFTKSQGGGEASSDPQAEMMRQMQRQMTDKLEVKKKDVSGTASFDGANGRLMDSEVVHDIEMEGPLPPMMQAMMGQQGGDAKMKQTITLTLRYVQDAAGAAPAKPATPSTPSTPAPGGTTPGQGGNGGGNGGHSNF
jgi:hypothetical protein